MDSSDTQSIHTLNDDELGRLVSIAIEEFGPDLPRIHFNDVLLALFECIPGLETIPTTIARQYLKDLWSRYQQVTKANQAV